MTEGEIFTRLCMVTNRLEAVARHAWDEETLRSALETIVAACDGIIDDLIDARIPGVRRREEARRRKHEARSKKHGARSTEYGEENIV